MPKKFYLMLMLGMQEMLKAAELFDSETKVSSNFFPTDWSGIGASLGGFEEMKGMPQPGVIPRTVRKTLVAARDYLTSPGCWNTFWNVFPCFFPLVGSMCLASTSSAFSAFPSVEEGNPTANYAGITSAIAGSLFANAGIFITFSPAKCFEKMIEARDIVNSKPWGPYLAYQGLTLYLWANYIACIGVQAELTGSAPPKWMPSWDGFTSSFFYGAGGLGVALSRLHATANIIIWIDDISKWIAKLIKGSEQKPFSISLIECINLAITLTFLGCNVNTWLFMYSLKFLDVFDMALTKTNRVIGAAFTVINPITFYFTARDALIHMRDFLEYSNSYLKRRDYSLRTRISFLTFEMMFMGYTAFCSTSGLTSATSRKEAKYSPTETTMFVVNITSLPKSVVQYLKNNEKKSTPSITSGLLPPGDGSIQNGSSTAASAAQVMTSNSSCLSSVVNFFRSWCPSASNRSERNSEQDYRAMRSPV